MRKVRGRKCYRVINKRTKKVFAKCSSLNKSKKQLRLLTAIHYNKKFVPYSRRKHINR